MIKTRRFIKNILAIILFIFVLIPLRLFYYINCGVIWFNNIIINIHNYFDELFSSLKKYEIKKEK